MTRRLAVVGIDGSGKSSLIAQLRARLDEDIAVISCPDFHDTDNGPLHELSRQLEAIGEAADDAGNAVIKAATLYLRMTLYGPVERFMLDTYRPDILVCERHPLIETLVYAPLYSRLAQHARHAPGELDAILAAAQQRAPGAAGALRRWQALESDRVGMGADVWTVLDEIVAVLDGGTAAAVTRFADTYRTALPDRVLWLDTPASEAAHRLSHRGGGREVHESATNLNRLRDGYAALGDKLHRTFPGTRFVRIPNADADDSERVLQVCLDAARFWPRVE